MKEQSKQWEKGEWAKGARAYRVQVLQVLGLQVLQGGVRSEIIIKTIVDQWSCSVTCNKVTVGARLAISSHDYDQ